MPANMAATATSSYFVVRTSYFFLTRPLLPHPRRYPRSQLRQILLRRRIGVLHHRRVQLRQHPSAQPGGDQAVVAEAGGDKEGLREVTRSTKYERRTTKYWAPQRFPSLRTSYLVPRTSYFFHPFCRLHAPG